MERKISSRESKKVMRKILIEMENVANQIKDRKGRETKKLARTFHDEEKLARFSQDGKGRGKN